MVDDVNNVNANDVNVSSHVWSQHKWIVVIDERQTETKTRTSDCNDNSSTPPPTPPVVVVVRLGEFLRSKLAISSGHVGRCLQRGWILVNHRVRTHKSAILTAGDVVMATATPFQMAQLRFEMPLLRMLWESPSYVVLMKPGGMPWTGNVSETVEKALPASMPHDTYEIVDCVSRITSGPILVSLDRRNTQSLTKLRKRFTFQIMVHGHPSQHRLLQLLQDDMDGFVSLRILQTIIGTSGTFTLLELVLNHSGLGLRGCLLRHGYPILGTSTRSKSKTNGCFLACTKLELLGRDDVDQDNHDADMTIVIDMAIPTKFQGMMDREQKFWNIKQQRDLEKVKQHNTLWDTFLHQCQQNGMINVPSNVGGESVVDFGGLCFYTTHDVMIPKQSSELLVQSAQNHLPKTGTTTATTTTNTTVSVLDLGTGSGCLLIATLIAAGSTIPTIQGVGVDISWEALTVAQINVQAHGLSDRIQLHHGDFADLSFLGQSTVFDIILCNPPYLTEAECKKDVLVGPHVALVAAHHDGFACYTRIAQQVATYMKPSGYLILEIGGKRNLDAILTIFHNFECLERNHDTQGRVRCLVFRKVRLQ